MNRKIDQNDQTRDQKRQSDQQRAEEKHRRQAGKDMPRQQGGYGQQDQQKAENQPRRQQGGWSEDEMRQGGRKPAMDRDRDYDPDGDRGDRIDRE